MITSSKLFGLGVRVLLRGVKILLTLLFLCYNKIIPEISQAVKLRFKILKNNQISHMGCTDALKNVPLVVLFHEANYEYKNNDKPNQE